MPDRTPQMEAQGTDSRGHRDYEAPMITVIGPLEEITFGSKKSGTDSVLEMGK
jgi:hypothetical protein